MELFVETVGEFQLQTIFAKRSVIDVWLGLEYASGLECYLKHSFYTLDFF